MDKKTVTRINNMSFNELKNELYNCYNNPIKERLIRELMVIKYTQHKQYIAARAQNKHKIKQSSTPVYKNPVVNDPDIVIVDDILDDFNFNFNDIEDLSSEESNKNKIIEYKKDTTNNNLMDRMDSDMEIKKMKVSTSKKDIVKPFVNTVCDNYATFKNEQGTNIKKFKSNNSYKS
jgi:hypothetical protein